LRSDGREKDVREDFVENVVREGEESDRRSHIGERRIGEKKAKEDAGRLGRGSQKVVSFVLLSSTADQHCAPEARPWTRTTTHLSGDLLIDRLPSSQHRLDQPGRE